MYLIYNAPNLYMQTCSKNYILQIVNNLLNFMHQFFGTQIGRRVGLLVELVV